MIVDDEEAARYGMRRALTTFGYTITEAGSAEAARLLLKQQETDLNITLIEVRTQIQKLELMCYTLQKLQIDKTLADQWSNAIANSNQNML